MNYLAHAYLSFHHPQILTGNMISDFVKGKKKFDYDELVQKGIMLHRYIDTFTDAHKASHEAKQVLKPAAGLYSGAFIDVVYDHFLALDTNELSEDEWMQFSADTYETLNKFQHILPEHFALMFPCMRKQNWLYNYRYPEGIENSFKGLARRATYLNSSEEVFILFKKNYDFLHKCYDNFFTDVKIFASAKLADLLKA